MWIINERNTLLGRIFYHLRSDFLLPHAEEAMVGRIIPENAHARHLLIERAHVVHLGGSLFISKLSHKTTLFLVFCRRLKLSFELGYKLYPYFKA